MTIRALILATLFVAGLATAAAAAPPAKKAAVADSTAVKKPAAKAKTNAPSVRTIDAINIEGEIAVPQVLFITSRDNRRYRDGLGKNFKLGTLDVARSVAMPSRLCVAGKSDPVSLKEE